MAKGRRSEPAAVKRAKGNPGRRQIKEPTNLPAEDLEAPPDWLSTADLKTDVAKRVSALTEDIWKRLHGDLVRLKLLKSTDQNTFARYCRYMAEWIEWTRVLDRDGAYYTTSSEHVSEIRRPHPAWRFRKDVEQALKELGESMGLTPASRQRIFQQLAERQASLPGMPQHSPSTPKSEEDGQPIQVGGGDTPVGFLGRLN